MRADEAVSPAEGGEKLYPVGPGAPCPTWESAPLHDAISLYRRSVETSPYKSNTRLRPSYKTRIGDMEFTSDQKELN